MTPRWHLLPFLSRMGLMMLFGVFAQCREGIKKNGYLRYGARGKCSI